MASQLTSQAAWSRDFYNSRSPTYDSTWHPSFAAKLVSYLPLTPGARVLDLACGTGLVTYNVANQVAPNGFVLGADVSDGMLLVAEAKREGFIAAHASQAKDVVCLRKHDVTDLQSLDVLENTKGSFDLVTCASALVLLADPDDTVKQWVQYLKPGGRIVLDVPDPHTLRAGMILEIVDREMNLNAGAWNRSWVEGPQSLEHVLVHAGCEVERVEFVTQTGGGVKLLRGTEDEAKKQFDVLENMVLKGQSGDVKKQLRLGFIEKWQKDVDEHGKVRDTDGTWVAVARKK